MEKSSTASALRASKWRQENRERYLRNNRHNTWRRLGIDITEANSLRDSVKNCEICNSSENLYVDHCHNSHRIRGILCRSCNAGLGNFRDNEELFLKAIDYLNKKPYN